MARGRPPTGSIMRDDAGRPVGVRVSLPGGSRRVVPFKREVTEAEARDLARDLARRAQELGMVPSDTLETVNEWFERWIAARRDRGLTSTGQDAGRYAKWIAPIIGTLPMVGVTRHDVERVVEHLDNAVRTSGGDFKWKTAINVWGVLSKMFADACRSKVLKLRVRDDNPARDVAGPDRGVERSGPYVFPAELDALLACERVPARWKRLVVLAVYLYVRRGELEALDWSAVNFDRGYVHVHRSVDERGNVKATKTRDTRKVPIEPTLLPLLEAMRDAAGGEGRVVSAMPPIESLASRLRRYMGWALEDAGMPAREELFADDETRRPLTWHDLRHTGITWRAVRGDEPLKVQRASGHSDLRTTQRYINEAQTFEDAGVFGVPFAPLPLAALMATDRPGGVGNSARTSGFSGRAAARSLGNSAVVQRPQGDSNPC